MTLNISNIKFSYFDKERNIKLPNEINEELAYLCGILAGDGHISKDYGEKCRNDISCGGNPKDEKEFYDITIKKLLKDISNIDIIPHSLGNTYGFRFGSKAIVSFLTRVIGLPSGKKYDSLKIPELFLQDKNLLLSFVRGLFDTDFGFCLCKKYRIKPYYPQICFDSKSENFTKGIWQTLKYLGIEFNGKVYRVYDKDERTKDSYTITYRFDLYGHKYFINVLKVIGLRHPKHIKKFEEWKKVNKKNSKVIKLIQRNSGGFPIWSIATSLDLNSSGLQN